MPTNENISAGLVRLQQAFGAMLPDKRGETSKLGYLVFQRVKMVFAMSVLSMYGPRTGS
jgi:hypothetical protein